MSARWRGLAIQVACWLVVAGVAGRELWWALQVRSAPVAAVTRVQPWWAPASVLALATALLITSFFPSAAAGPTRDRRASLLPILTVVLLFVEVLVLGSFGTPVPPDQQLELALGAFCEQARAAPEHVDALDQTLASFGPPPYYAHGAQLDRFHVRVVQGADCTEVPPGVAPLTFLWCVKEGHAKGRVVALPAEERTGPPEIFSRNGRPLGCE